MSPYFRLCHFERVSFPPGENALCVKWLHRHEITIYYPQSGTAQPTLYTLLNYFSSLHHSHSGDSSFGRSTPWTVGRPQGFRGWPQGFRGSPQERGPPTGQRPCWACQGLASTLRTAAGDPAMSVFGDGEASPPVCCWLGTKSLHTASSRWEEFLTPTDSAAFKLKLSDVLNFSSAFPQVSFAINFTLQIILWNCAILTSRINFAVSEINEAL